MNTINLTQSDKSESPYLLIQNSLPEQATVVLQSTQVDVQIDGIIADVSVKQTYVNESTQTLEAIYVFAGSTRAAVYGLDMRVGEREIHAKVKKQETARREYNKAKEEGKTAGLLEQHRPNVFQMNVANIRPGDVIDVVMHYTELLVHCDGLYEFVYPGVVGPRYSTEGEKWVEQSIKQLTFPVVDFDVKVSINAGVPVQTVACTSHQIRTEHNDEHHTILTLANPFDKQSDRDFIIQYGLRGSKVQTGMMCYQHSDGEQFFLLMAQPPLQTSIEQILPREFIFIVDVSASMYGFPLEVSKTILRKLLSSLRPTDIFNVMLFEFSRQMFSDQSLPATPENIEKALQLIDEQAARGGTNLYQALQTAFDFKTTPDFARTFILATDGYVTVESRAFQLVADQRNQANLFALGIGRDVNRHLIEGLAYAGAGEAYIITNQTEAETIGAKLINDITMPVWSHINIDWGKFEVQDITPVSVPDLFAAKPVIVYGKYKGDAEGKIVIKGRKAGRDFKQIIHADKAEMVQSEALRYLWARNRIKYLSDYASCFEDGVTFIYQKETQKHQKEITELGLKYNLLTKYTSFLAVDDETFLEVEDEIDVFVSVSEKSILPRTQMSYHSKETSCMKASWFKSLFMNKKADDHCSSLFSEDDENEIFRLPKPDIKSEIKVITKIDLSAINQSTRPKKKTKEEKRRERNEKEKRFHERIRQEEFAIKKVNETSSENDMEDYTYYELGNSCKEKGVYTKAIENYNIAIAIYSDDEDYYAERGEAKMLNEDYVGAIADLTKAIEIDPKYIFALYTRARLFTLMGKPDNAKADYETIVSLGLAVAEENFLTPFVLFYLGRKEEAIRWQNQLLRKKPTAEIEYNTACLYAVMNETVLALKYFELALKNGYSDIDHIRKDEDLDNIRKLPRFNKIIDSIFGENR